MTPKPSTNSPHAAAGPIKLEVDREYLLDTLLRLLQIPSPAGYTDTIVHFLGEELSRLGIEFEMTRRGAIRATLPGRRRKPNRAWFPTSIRSAPWSVSSSPTAASPSPRWAHGPHVSRKGARCTIFTDEEHYRGTILPLKASGHVYDDEIDTFPISWDHVEVRVDERVDTEGGLFDLGFRVGNFIAIDPQPEITDNGFINSRHLDDKAGVAAMLEAARAIVTNNVELPLDCHLLFTIFEEVGSGASAVLHQDVAEMLAIDNATPAPTQNATEYDVTIAVKDSSGPFDYHLTRKLLALAREHDILHGRDVMRHYRCDAASAVEAGNDIRVALIAFGVDASHGYERTHIDSLINLSQLMSLYVQSEPAVERDRMELGPMKGFPEQPTEPPPVPEKQQK